MTLGTGTRLGTYEILALLGKGGMGEVYRATDTRLKREVAIKILPDEFSEDTDRVGRFQREAELLASLNHPNIAGIYDLQESNGSRYLVLELVEGETLAERMQRGPVPIDEALNIAMNISEALEAAHERGIIHRDLKPANIKITPDGKVKVLDFGLAKAMESTPASATLSNSPTMLSGTMGGVILGTSGYMSPEQARGKPVDKRTDIWAFGVVLYETLTGRRLFEGEDVTATLAAVVMKEPDWDAVPARVRRLLQSCLEKDSKKRLRDIGDVWRLLEKGPEEPPPQVQTRVTNGNVYWVATAVAIIAAVALGYVSYRHWTEETRVLRLSIPPPEKGAFAGPNSIPAVSPDGRHVAFVADVDGKRGLWVRDLDTLAPRLLPGTEDVRFPFWSPDSRAIAFFADRRLKKIDLAGGPPVTVCDSGQGAGGGSWSKDGVILFTPSGTSGLFRVSAAGGMATPVTTLDQGSQEVSHRFPWFLPDGRHFLFVDRNAERQKTTIAYGDIESKSYRPVLLATSNVAYTPPGYLLFIRERTLMAQPFDAGEGKTTGEAVPIAEQVDTPGLVFAESHFSVSQNGVLVYRSVRLSGGWQPTWFDRTGVVKGTVGKPIGGSPSWVAISPDGKTVTMAKPGPSGTGDLWLYDLASARESRFTFGPATNQWPVWSPDGSQIAFTSTRDGLGAVYKRAASGAAQDELVDKAANNRNIRVDDWSREYMIETRGDPQTGNDIWILPLSSGKTPFPYVHSEALESNARLSPNAQWLAYNSDESKQNEIYVQTFPEPRGKWQVSADGGSHPAWSRDGKELYFVAPDRKMMAVEIKGGSNFDHGVPKPLFENLAFDSFSTVPDFSRYDVGKDGSFLIPTPVDPAANAPLTIWVNWTAGLKK